MPIEQISVKDKQELERIVTEEMNAIENGLTILYNNIKIDPKTNLDLLCYDANGRLVVLKLSVVEDDNALFEGLRCINYIDTVKPMLRAAYGKAGIDENAQPRLALIAPSFSSNLRNVVENTNVIEVDLYQWDYLQIGDKRGLYAHSVFEKKQPARIVVKEEESKQPKKTAEKKMKPQPISPIPEQKKEEPAPPTPSEVVMPPDDLVSTTEQKKQEKEKKKSIFSL